MTLSLLEYKSLLRQRLRSERERRSAEFCDISLFTKNFIRCDFCPPHSLIAGYIPFRGELDVLPLLKHLRAQRHSLVLPRVVHSNQPLEFRHWQEKHPLVPNKMGLLEPPCDSPLAEPDILIVPLLAFDKKCNRLGYGGGFYDRTLEALQAHKKIKAIGVAYSYQEIDEVPTEPHDVRLQHIVTEVNVF